MDKTTIYKAIVEKLGMVKEEVWSYEIELIDEVLNLVYMLNSLDNKLDKRSKMAFLLGKKVELWKVKDADFSQHAEVVQKRCEESIGDIVENYPELEELIPSPICWR